MVFAVRHWIYSKSIVMSSQGTITTPCLANTYAGISTKASPSCVMNVPQSTLPWNTCCSSYMLGTHALFSELTFLAALWWLDRNLHFQLISLVANTGSWRHPLPTWRAIQRIWLCTSALDVRLLTYWSLRHMIGTGHLSICAVLTLVSIRVSP